MIRVFITDDQEIVREGLKNILQSDPEISVVGLAKNGQEAVDFLQTVQTDLVLMDLHMPVLNGPAAIRKIRERQPDLPILVLTTYSDDSWLFDAIRSGASGYILKDRSGDALIEAVKNTVGGGYVIDPAVAGKVVQNAITQPKQISPESLGISDRELEILTLLVKGYSNPEIAKLLYLSEGTIRNHMTSLFSKLAVEDRTQAAVKAIKTGLISLKQI